MAGVMYVSKNHTLNFRSIKALFLRIFTGMDEIAQVDLHLVISY